MGAPRTLVWQLEPHTRAKHEILRRYLEAWAAILSLGKFPTIAYVDGFAGPGTYESGDDGSPIIAIKAALQHAARIPKTTNLLFLFVEKDEERAERLEQLVTGMSLPANFRVNVASGQTFEEGFRAKLLDFYEKKNKSLPPTFAFIDPFGWKGVPFHLVKKILSNPSCEVLINFMFEEINRFINHPDQRETFDELFGTDRWRQMEKIVKPMERRRFLHDLYLTQLRDAAGAKYVRSFEMRNDKDVTDYFLFFATNSAKGMQKMKEAMWKVDQSGEFRFSDATNPAQALLFSPQPDYESLKRSIVSHFDGAQTSVAEIEDFVLASTPFRETHYKKQVLAPLERIGAVRAIDPPTGRKPGTFSSPTMRLQFGSSSQSVEQAPASSIFDDVYKLCDAGEEQKAIESVVARFEQDLRLNRLNEANEALRQFDVERVRPAVVVAALTITFAAKAVLNEREAFVEKAERWLRQTLGDERAENLLATRR